MSNHTIQQLAARCQPGYSLPAEFYNSREIFQRDIEQFVVRGWIYACHRSELPEVGDHVVREIAGESVIVVRSASDRIEAHANVCRHRGSRVCLNQRGQAKHFTCPYHGWVYGLDGRLIASREMPKEFDKSAFGLKSINTVVVQGLVFVNLDNQAPALDKLAEPLDAALSIYALPDTQVAYQQTWQVEANWKLAVENFMECYHCTPAHPEYARGHSLTLPDRLSEKLYEPLYTRSRELGISCERIWSADSVDPLFAVFHHRQPLLNDNLTGSEDGQPVAPLLGTVPGYDGGAADIQFGLFCYGLIYPDHVVLYSFLPLGEELTDMQVVWLVREDACEGNDYDVERLTWLWRVTTDADKTIILNNQLGVNSRYYEPGPYSEMETFTRDFVEWYLERLQQH